MKISASSSLTLSAWRKHQLMSVVGEWYHLLHVLTLGLWDGSPLICYCILNPGL